MDMVEITEKLLKDTRTRNKVLLMLIGCMFLCCLIYVGLSIDWSPAKPVPTRLPTPVTDINSMIGQTNTILDLVINGVAWYELKPESCEQLPGVSNTSENEEKVVVVEMAMRNKWSSIIQTSEYAFVDAKGKVYKAKKAYDYVMERQFCLPNISVPGDSGYDVYPYYGSHFYIVSDTMPADTSGLRLSFNVRWRMDYFDVYLSEETPEVNEVLDPTPTPKLVETAVGVTRFFLDLGNAPKISNPNKDVLGYPGDKPVDNQSSVANDLKLTIGDVGIIPEEKASFGSTGQQYYLNLQFENAGKTTSSGMYQFIKLNIVDAFGAKLPCKFESDSGFGNTMSPGETQTYYCTFSVENSSLNAGPLIMQFENGQYLKYEKKYISMPVMAAIEPTPVPAEEEPSVDMVNTCGLAPNPHLVIGKNVYVTFKPPLPNRIREQAGLDGKYITSYKPGTVLNVVSGPSCVDDMNWWQVKNERTGVVGWTSEGSEGVYWIENCKDEGACY